MMRTKYSKTFKARVALDAIKAQKTVAEITSEYGIQTTQVGAWKRQLLTGAEDIFNSDQGVQYTSNDFTGMLKSHSIKISMDGKGRWMSRKPADLQTRAPP